MGCREDFINYFDFYRSALGVQEVSSSTLATLGPSKILRNGLAVVGFSALEDFIKRRFVEVFDGICETAIRFDQLPEKIQQAVTFEAIGSLGNQLKMRKEPPSGKIKFIQEEARKIASTYNSDQFELTGYAFVFGKSNVNENDVKAALSAFQIKDPWGVISRLSQVAGIASLPLDNSYSNAYERRNRAAHVASADTPYSDIDNFRKEAVSIAFGFDVLITSCLYRMASLDPDYLNGKKLGVGDFSFYFIKKVEGRWKAYFSLSPDRAKAVNDNYDDLLPRVEALAKNHRNALLSIGENNEVIGWYFP